MLKNESVPYTTPTFRWSPASVRFRLESWTPSAASRAEPRTKPAGRGVDESRAAAPDPFSTAAGCRAPAAVPFCAYRGRCPATDPAGRDTTTQGARPGCRPGEAAVTQHRDSGVRGNSGGDSRQISFGSVGRFSLWSGVQVLSLRGAGSFYACVAYGAPLRLPASAAAGPPSCRRLLRQSYARAETAPYR